MGARTPSNGAGIVSFRHARLESVEIVRRLKAADMVAAPRQGWVRVSPHFYIAPEEIDRLVELVAGWN
jgi:selenocysteine lyase/cysteine desulfurase